MTCSGPLHMTCVKPWKWLTCNSRDGEDWGKSTKQHTHISLHFSYVFVSMANGGSEVLCWFEWVMSSHTHIHTHTGMAQTSNLMLSPITHCVFSMLSLVLVWVQCSVPGQYTSIVSVSWTSLCRLSVFDIWHVYMYALELLVSSCLPSFCLRRVSRHGCGHGGQCSVPGLFTFNRLCTERLCTVLSSEVCYCFEWLCVSARWDCVAPPNSCLVVSLPCKS